MPTIRWDSKLASVAGKHAPKIEKAFGYTTVGDLAKWMRNFRTAQVGGDDLFERMTERYVLTTGDTTEYGLGLFVDEYRGVKRVHHGGADVAHRSMLNYYPTLDAGVLTLSNNATFNAGSMSNRVADAFLEEHFEPRDDDAQDENLALFVRKDRQQPLEDFPPGRLTDCILDSLIRFPKVVFQRQIIPPIGVQVRSAGVSRQPGEARTPNEVGEQLGGRFWPAGG